MPQLVPFYFIAQFSAALFVLLVLTEVFGAYLLPLITGLTTARAYIAKL